jgi:hypothetical protein
MRIFLLFAFISLPLLTFAQTAPVQSRITQAVDEANLTVLKGTRTIWLAPNMIRARPLPACP